MFCPDCGTKIPDDAIKCTNCNAEIKPLVTENTASEAPAAQPAEQPVVAMAAPAGTTQGTASSAKGFASTDPEAYKYKGLAMLCYCGTLFVILALVAAPKSSFVRFHANQSVCLQVFILLSCLLSIIPFIGWLALCVVYIMIFVFFIMGLVNAKDMKEKELPIVGKYRIF